MFPIYNKQFSINVQNAFYAVHSVEKLQQSELATAFCALGSCQSAQLLVYLN
jgi:hypothetical protein